MEPSSPSSTSSFKAFGLDAALVEATEAMGWKKPTPIQAATLPAAMEGRDVIGLAETGSGKTASFLLPILHALLQRPRPFFAVILAPTRELALQIADQCRALGGGIGAKVAVLVGGVSMMDQAVMLARNPHIIVGTPGRVVDHLENTKGVSFGTVGWLVLDEADRMLSLDFETAIHKVLLALPPKHTTLLFSATMTSKVDKLQRASLRDPVRYEVSAPLSTVSSLDQRFVLCPHRKKDAYLIALLTESSSSTAIIFAATCASAQRIGLVLRILAVRSRICVLHGQMPQSRRLGALHKFREGKHTSATTTTTTTEGGGGDGEEGEGGGGGGGGSGGVLVATDVASRGLDIPTVDLVINYDVPTNPKDYVHRVGRTARAGKAGKAITIVTQYDVEAYQRIEKALGLKMEAVSDDPKEVATAIEERVAEANRQASRTIREAEASDVGTKRARSVGDAVDGGIEDLLLSSKAKRRKLRKAMRKKRK